MTEVQGYIRRILKGTYLRRGERKVLSEEMENHIEECKERYIAEGMTDKEAHQKAISCFGSEKLIRKRIIRETFVISPRWYLTASFLFFLCLLATLYTFMRFDDIIIIGQDPSAWKQIPNPGFVVWLHSYFPLYANRWVALCVMSVMLLFARKHADRLAVLVSLLPFCVPLVIEVFNRTMALESRSMFFLDPTFQPLGTSAAIGYAYLMGIGVLLYAWTKNRVVSVTPWVISIAMTIWPSARDAVQYALFVNTHNPIFWGHFFSWGNAWYVAVSMIVRVIVLMIFVLATRWLDAISIRRANAA